MKITRLLSYAAVAALGTTLWSSWVKEHPQATKKADEVKTTQASAQSKASDSQSFVPDTFNPVAKQKEQIKVEEAIEKRNEKLIDISTDTLQLKVDLDSGIQIVDALNEKSGFLNSNGEARRALKENSISINKEKVKEDYIIKRRDLIADKFILLQRGKRNYFLLKLK